MLRSWRRRQWLFTMPVGSLPWLSRFLPWKIRRLPQFSRSYWVWGRWTIVEIFLDFFVLDMEILVKSSPLSQVAGEFQIQFLRRQPFIGQRGRRDEKSVFVKLVKDSFKTIKDAHVFPLRKNLVG